MLKVGEGGRTVTVPALLTTGVNAEGYREILGMHVISAEDGACWLGFVRNLTARGLTGVRSVTSDGHRGPVDAIGATLPGATWRRCRTHYAANLMSATPKARWGWVKALLHSVYDKPDADAVHAQFDRIVEALTDKLPAVAAHLDTARADILAVTAFSKAIWWQTRPRYGGCGHGVSQAGLDRPQCGRGQRPSVVPKPAPGTRTGRSAQGRCGVGVESGGGHCGGNDVQRPVAVL